MKPFQKDRKDTDSITWQTERQTAKEKEKSVQPPHSEADKQVGLFMPHNVSKLFSIHQTHISSCHLKWFVLRGRGRTEAGYSGDQATIFNFKSISRKHCKANEAVNIVYPCSALTKQTKTYLYHSYLFLPSTISPFFSALTSSYGSITEAVIL